MSTCMCSLCNTSVPVTIRNEVIARGWSLTGSTSTVGKLKFFHCSNQKMLAFDRELSKYVQRYI